ncbi:MAG: hydroxymethylbilane synthase [Methanophagales archaeon]|nr:hydroxymethylbilane synthase [Methanophagales archaeon]
MIIGTRGSKLAVRQTEEVCKRLRECEQEQEQEQKLSYEIRRVPSLGDVMIDQSLSEMPEKGVFVKKLDKLLLCGEIDLAVHSMKDIPLERDEKLEIAAVLPRGSPYDAFVSKYKLDDLPDGAVIGTSSIRRKYQFMNYTEQKSIKVKMSEIRGNVETRIAKLRKGEYDGLILAEAGLERLKLNLYIDYHCERLDYDPFVPSPGQGIIAVVARRGSDASKILRAIDDSKTRIEADVEEAVLSVMGGGCSLPVGVHAYCNGDGAESEVKLAVYRGLSADSDTYKYNYNYVLEKTVIGLNKDKDLYLEEAREFIKDIQLV